MGEAGGCALKTRDVETVLLVGGGSGMGRAVAEALCRPSIRIFVADLDISAAEQTCEAAVASGGRAEALPLDVSQSESVAALFGELKRRVDRLDLMVQTAAILGRTAFIEEMTDEEWHRMIAVNLNGAFYCCREAVRWMKMHQTGRIILFSSVAALTPTPGSIHYSAAKGAVNMFGRTLAQEAAKHNIRVNIVAPGYIQTPMLDGLPGGFPDYILKKTPLRRLGEVGEIAALVRFLASPEADFFTGQILSPNGGLVI
jgi:NAD(P)-dependent dehydrogenase (short-subunit alcohol dehydrogenase family)